eukprot:618969-Rhodomonas_salina.2
MEYMCYGTLQVGAYAGPSTAWCSVAAVVCGTAVQQYCERTAQYAHAAHAPHRFCTPFPLPPPRHTPSPFPLPSVPSIPSLPDQRCPRRLAQDLYLNDMIDFTAELLLPILTDVAAGMGFLHACKPPIIHSDLNAGNVLVDDRCPPASLPHSPLSPHLTSPHLTSPDLTWHRPLPLRLLSPSLSLSLPPSPPLSSAWGQAPGEGVRLRALPQASPLGRQVHRLPIPDTSCPLSPYPYLIPPARYPPTRTRYPLPAITLPIPDTRCPLSPYQYPIPLSP